MKCKALVLGVVCVVGLAQVQDAQAMSWFRKKPEPSKWEKAKPWVIGGCIATGVGSVIAFRKQIGNFGFALSEGYAHDYNRMHSGDNGFKDLKEGIRTTSWGNYPLTTYQRNMGLNNLALRGLWLLNCKNDVGEKLSRRIAQMDAIDYKLSGDREVKQEGRNLEQKERLDRIEEKLDQQQQGCK